MPAVYRRHDLLLQGAVEELEGMAVLEALATGMPVVATSVGIAASLPDRLVSTVPVRDPDTMAHAIVTSLASRAHATRAAVEGTRLVRASFSAQRSADMFVDLYRALLPPSLEQYVTLPECLAHRVGSHAASPILELLGAHPESEQLDEQRLHAHHGNGR
jgi:hypothetical protein